MTFPLKTLLPFLFFASAANATPEHPLVGVYYTGGLDGQAPEYTADQEKGNCALSFTISKPDGSFVSYLLDKPTFESTGMPRYDIWIAGSCTISDNQKFDSCKTSKGVAGEGASPPETSYIYDAIAADRVSFRFFDTGEAAAVAFKNGDSKAGEKMHATRCPFNEIAVQPFLGTSLTNLTIDTWSPLVLPDITPEHLAFTAKVNAAIAAGKK
jgi:hypothetical protein